MKSKQQKQYSKNVFLNFPFDKPYEDIRDAIIFAVYDCGFVPRCALEEDDSGVVRISKIERMIQESQYAIHDISRTQLDPTSQLPRFNMPLELGIFLGAKRYGPPDQKKKSCLVLDSEKYRYQKFISDISGNDIRSHSNDPEIAIKHVRDWLSSKLSNVTVPGGAQMSKKFREFQQELPILLSALKIGVTELTYNDYSNILSEWLKGH